MANLQVQNRFRPSEWLFDWFLTKRFRDLLVGAGIVWLIFALIFTVLPCFFPGNGVTDNSVEPTEPTEYAQLADSLYFSTVTFTTLGYGDFHPVGIGKFFAALEAALGLMFFGAMVAKLTSRDSARLHYLLQGFGGTWIVRAEETAGDQRILYGQVTFSGDEKTLGLQVIGRDFDRENKEWHSSRYDAFQISNKGARETKFLYATKNSEFQNGEMTFSLAVNGASKLSGNMVNSKAVTSHQGPHSVEKAEVEDEEWQVTGIKIDVYVAENDINVSGETDIGNPAPDIDFWTEVVDQYDNIYRNEHL